MALTTGSAVALTAAASLLVVGVGLIFINARKLIADWPLPKPRHNVDLAWIQIYLGLALVIVAWFIGADPARALREPLPSLSPPAQSSGG